MWQDKNGGNKERAGGPNNNLLADGGVGATIGMAPGARTMVNQLTRTHQQRGGDSHKALRRAFQELRTMCERLGVPDVVYDRSCEIFRDIHAVGIKGRKPSAVNAACIFIACRQEKIPRTFKEITPVAQDTNKVEIWRVFNAIKDKLKISQAKLGVISTTSFVERWSSTLKLDPEAKKAAKEIATIACPNASHSRKWDTRSHISVTAAALLLVVRAGGGDLNPAEVARRTGVAVGTIKDVYEELRAEAASLVPGWFVEPAELQRRLGLGGASASVAA